MLPFSTPGFLTRSGLAWLAFESFNLGNTRALEASLFPRRCVLYSFHGVLGLFSPS